jgi:hypothetical protein
VRCSLKTADLRQANAKAIGLHAEWIAKFDQLKRADNPVHADLTPALLAVIAAKIRPNEVAQLYTDDVFESGEAGGLAIEFRENPARQQRLKKKPRQKVSPSWRCTPLHSFVDALGFRAYWEAMSANGPAPLFPALSRKTQNGPIGGVSHWFGTYKTEQGFADQGKDLHSFRYSVRSALGFKGVGDAIVASIQGHSTGKVQDTHYGEAMRRESEALRPFVELMRYPGLVLPRVFDKPAWHSA